MVIFRRTLNSWIAGSHENWYTTNKNEFTVLQLEIIFICLSLLVPEQASQENLLVWQVLCTSRMSRAWLFHTPVYKEHVGQVTFTN
jgi:hypothetical protein